MKLSRNEKGFRSEPSKLFRKIKAFPAFQKIIIFLIITIFLAAAIYAACDVLDTLDKTETKAYDVSDSDYNISFESLTNESGDVYVKFKVNGITTENLEAGMKHTFTDLSEITISNIIIGVDSANDTAQFCFNSGLSCIGCGSCISNTYCEDNNSCTIDECDGDPLFCHHKLILWCRDDDGCCPESRCTGENDNDCGKPILTGCINNSECDDFNTSTTDICDNNTRRCNNTLITMCIAGDDYCPKNCTMETDADCDGCSEEKDCNDDDACTSDACSGTPKRCSYEATDGCNIGGECISIGTITEDKFCSKWGITEYLKTKKEYCDKDYECISSICKKNRCKNKSVFIRMGGWFKGLFGK